MRPDPRHLKGSGRRERESDLEGIRTVRNVIGGVRMPLGSTQVDDRPLLQISRAFHRGHHHRRRAIGLNTAIEFSERFRNIGRGHIGL